MTVIVLIECSVCPVCIPCLTIAITMISILIIITFIILEHRIFTFPRPDSGCYTLPATWIICRIHLTGTILSHIVLNQWLIYIHGCDCITTGSFNVIVLNCHITGSIFFQCCFIQMCTVKLCPCIGISCCDTPAVCCYNATVFNCQIIEFGSAGSILICWFLYNKINTTICHMFVDNIAVYIMNIQIIQNNMIYRTFILRYTSHTGTIHNICVVIF